MLKSNFHLFQELNKLRNQGCCLDVSLIGHDGNVSIHLPLLMAANPWVGDSIDHRDSIHVIMLPDYSVMELESFVTKLYCCPPDPDPVPTPYFSVPSTPTEVFHTPPETPNHHHHHEMETGMTKQFTFPQHLSVHCSDLDAQQQANKLPADPGPELPTLLCRSTHRRHPDIRGWDSHQGARVHPLSRQSLHEGCSGQHLLPQPGVHPPVAGGEQHCGVLSVPAPVRSHRGHLQGHPGPALQARGYSRNTDDADQ